MLNFAHNLNFNIMTTEQLGYDKTSIASIFKYSQKLIGHSLRELVAGFQSARAGQGRSWPDD